MEPRRFLPLLVAGALLAGTLVLQVRALRARQRPRDAARLGSLVTRRALILTPADVRAFLLTFPADGAAPGFVDVYCQKASLAPDTRLLLKTFQDELEFSRPQTPDYIAYVDAPPDPTKSPGAMTLDLRLDGPNATLEMRSASRTGVPCLEMTPRGGRLVVTLAATDLSASNFSKRLRVDDGNKDTS